MEAHWDCRGEETEIRNPSPPGLRTGQTSHGFSEGETSGQRQHLLNAPLVGSGHYNAERSSPNPEADEAQDRAARWRLARHTYHAALLSPLEDSVALPFQNKKVYYKNSLVENSFEN